MPAIADSTNLSEAFIVLRQATLAIDDQAFPCELSDRINGRAQTVIYGTVKGHMYKTGGVKCDLTKLTSPGKFPLGNYRVVVQLDTTGTYYAVFNHSTKKILMYTGIGSEIANLTNVSAIIFPFMAVGE